MRLTIRFILVAAIAVAATLPASAQTDCAPTRTNEELTYSWRLRGPISWIAGLAFPTRGKGVLRTSELQDNLLDTELRIAGPSRDDGYYLYQSQMEQASARTLMTYDGYGWRHKSRSERTLFDYVKRLMRIRRENSERVETRVRKIPGESGVRDILTGIYFLRQNADQIEAPLLSEIYSRGKLYPVVFKPQGRETLTWDGNPVETRKFEITAAPGTEKKWPGGVKVWISDDENRTPIRLEIKRDYAALQLDLTSATNCN